jgi:flavodoxin
MKNAVVYYSYSGNTRKVAKTLTEILRLRSDSLEIDLKPLDESKSFLMQCHRAFKHIRAKLEPVNFDLSGYDLICFGSPVWAFGPAPAMNTYLDNCSGITGKDIILFTTYGSGTGNERCLNYMEDILKNKGAKTFKRFSIQQSKTKDREFVRTNIEQITRL